MTRRKIIASVLIIMLLSAVLMPTVAFGASSDDYIVENMSYIAELHDDGSAVITENWTVLFSENAKNAFERKIEISGDDFKHISGINDLSVSVDGSICSEESSDSLRRGAYFFEIQNDAYVIRWNLPEEKGTHSYSLRYSVPDAVKIYNEKAYFYFQTVNENDRFLCKNISAVVCAPSECFPEDFEIYDSGVLAGKKEDGKITFSCINSVGEIKASVSMPQDLFDTSSLTHIVNDTTGLKIGIAVFVSVLVVVAVLFLRFALNYKKLFRRHYKKKCREKPTENNSSQIFDDVLSVFSPAEVLNIVTGETLNKSDLFTVTVLDLVKRGYINAEKNDFIVNEKSDFDKYSRPFNDCEKRVLEIFSEEKWKVFLRKPFKFYKEIETFNKKVRFVSPFFVFGKNGKTIIKDCFEIRLSAKQYEYVSPAEISESFFKNDKYGVGDLIVSVINEYDRHNNGLPVEPDGEFKRNMFMFRDFYSDGKIIFDEKEAERKRRKNGDEE